MRHIRTQVLHQEAHPTIWPLLTPKTRPSLGVFPPKWEKTCHRSGQTAMQNFTPIGKAQAEKSVTIYTNKVKYCKLSIPPYTVLRMAG